MSEKYLANRLKYHTASRVGAKEQDPLLNALNKDQHTVHYKDVWTSPIEDFPINTGTYKDTTDSTDATNNLIEVFKNGATSVNFRNGKIWTNLNYPAVKLYEAVDMHPVDGSNGSGILFQSYEVLDENDIRLQDWVSPMAVFDPVKDKPVPGYAGKLELNLKNTSTWVEVQKTDKSTASGIQGSVWDASYGNWEFVYSAGMAIFNADYTPTRYASSFATDSNGIVKLRWTGFLYTGLYLDTKLANTFAGITLDDINLNLYDTVGIVRITDTVSGTKPPISSVVGFLQVMDINHDEDRNDSGALNTKRRIRQIIYPDNPDESTPYSRVGTSDTLTGDIDWSEWTQMGGGALRRIVVPTSTTTLTLSNNTMYETFHNCSFTLPNPDTVPIGTRIGIEQFVGVSSVVSGEFTMSVSADVPDPEFTTVPSANAISYIFECCLKEDGVSREWILDIEHNYAAAITTVVGLINDIEDRVETNEQDIVNLKTRATNLESRATNHEAKDRAHDTDISSLKTRATNLETRATNLETRATNLETRATNLEAKDGNLHSEFINQIARQTKHVKWGDQVTSDKPISVTVPTQAQVDDPAKMSAFLASNPYNLYYYDLVCSIMTNGVTIVIPKTNVPLGTKVTFELFGGYSATISDGTNSEKFTAESGIILVLEFEYTILSNSANGWTLLSLA